MIHEPRVVVLPLVVRACEFDLKTMSVCSRREEI